MQHSIAECIIAQHSIVKQTIAYYSKAESILVQYSIEQCISTEYSSNIVQHRAMYLSTTQCSVSQRSLALYLNTPKHRAVYIGEAQFCIVIQCISANLALYRNTAQHRAVYLGEAQLYRNTAHHRACISVQHSSVYPQDRAPTTARRLHRYTSQLTAVQPKICWKPPSFGA